MSSDETTVGKLAMMRRAANQYTRVGVDYFKLIEKQDRFGTKWNDLKRWSKAEIRQDHGGDIVDLVPKYDDFILVPDNNGVASVVDNCYNMYKPVPFKPAEGDTKWTIVMLEQIFGDQIEQGLRYLQCIYQHPDRPLPVLALVSTERQTGKSTFLDWLGAMFGMNMVMIDPEVIGSSFNSEYAAANIIGIDETIIERKTAIEKIKSLATKKFISVNMKFVAPFTLPFYGKIILASNNETDFMRVDQEEIRFWVRKLPTPTITNHNILNDSIKEIPAFMWKLNQMPQLDFSKSRMLFTPEEIVNETLKEVKRAGRSSLYKNLLHRFRDWFDEEERTRDVTARSTDIKDLWYPHNNQVDLYYISRVLRDEFKAVQPPKNYINADENLTRVGVHGRGYIITKKMLDEN